MSPHAHQWSARERFLRARYRPDLTALEAVLLYGLACAALPTGTRVTATLAAAEGDAATVAYGAACKLYLELRKTCPSAL